jgi:hypothetical protein
MQLPRRFCWKILYYTLVSNLFIFGVSSYSSIHPKERPQNNRQTTSTTRRVMRTCSMGNRKWLDKDGVPLIHYFNGLVKPELSYALIKELCELAKLHPPRKSGTGENASSQVRCLEEESTSRHTLRHSSPHSPQSSRLFCTSLAPISIYASHQRIHVQSFLANRHGLLPSQIHMIFRGPSHIVALNQASALPRIFTITSVTNHQSVLPIFCPTAVSLCIPLNPRHCPLQMVARGSFVDVIFICLSRTGGPFTHTCGPFTRICYPITHHTDIKYLESLASKSDQSAHAISSPAHSIPPHVHPTLPHGRVFFSCPCMSLQSHLT